MSQTEKNSNYPLPEALTRRVLTYLNLFRIFISFLLMIAFFSGIFIKAYFLQNSGIAGTFLIAYFVMAVFLALEARRPNTQYYFLAQISLFTDILFLTVLLFLFDGPNSGLAVLLIFASASGAILLTLKLSLFLASLVTLAFIGEALSGLLLRGESLTDLM